MTVAPTSRAGSGGLHARTTARLAWLACGLALMLLTAGLVLLWTSPDGPLPEGYASRAEQAISLVSLLGPPLLGGLLAARRPSNPYGWLWAAYGWAGGGRRLHQRLCLYVTASGAGMLGWAGSIAWMGNVAFVPLIGLTALILLLFPDGRPPSRRWRWVTRAIGVTVVVTTVAGALLPADEGDPIGNPLAVQGSIEALADTVANVGITALFWRSWLGGLAAAAVPASQGLQRQQLKWLAYGGGFLAAYILLDMISQVPPGLVDALIEALTFGALYVGVGMAVLRYRLYDIDRIINRTLVYGLLTVLLAGVYASAVLILGQVFGGVGRIRRAGPWPAPPWPGRRCSSRRGVVSRRSWIGASTGASTTRPRPSRRSPPGSATSSTSMRCRPSCWPWSTRRCSQVRRPCGSVHRPMRDRPVKDERALSGPTRLDPLHAMQFRPPRPPQVSGVRLPNRRLRVTVSVRWIPLVTAAYGTGGTPARTTISRLTVRGPPLPHREGCPGAPRPLFGKEKNTPPGAPPPRGTKPPGAPGL